MNETTWKSKHFLVLLYPDNPEHLQTFFLLRSKYNCAYIAHDKDVFDEEDLVDHPDRQLGAPKKTHWHVVVTFPNQKWNTSFAKEIKLELRWIKKCDELRNGLRYLIHRDHPNKFQYEPEQVKGSLTNKFITVLQDKTPEIEQVCLIMDFIDSYQGILSYTTLTKWALAHDCWSSLRRSFSIIKELVNEKNMLTYEKQSV